MEISRNQYFMAGLVLLFLGLQFRAIESVELKEEFAKLMAKKSDNPLNSVGSQIPVPAALDIAAVSRTVHPPEWIGWLLLSLGGVLVLHSLAMPKGGGGG